MELDYRTEHFDIHQDEAALSLAKLHAFGRAAERDYARLCKSLEMLGCNERFTIQIISTGVFACSADGSGVDISPNYLPGAGRNEVFAHELVHAIAARAYGYAISFLREGVAYHFTQSGFGRPRNPLAELRCMRHYLVARAADDGNLPSLGEFLLTPFFWGVWRYSSQRLSEIIGTAASASFTHFLFHRYQPEKYWGLYHAMHKLEEEMTGRWEPNCTLSFVSEYLGTEGSELENAWLRFARKRASRNPWIAEIYDRGKAKCGAIILPTPATNCHVCGWWWQENEQECPKCQRARA